MDAATLIKMLNLSPMPTEGGYFRETYRCDEVIRAHALPPGYSGERCCSTAIYYLLTPDTFSAMHRVLSDEVFHFYAGDPVEMLQLRADGSHTTTIIGSRIELGEAPQVIVRRGDWQGCRLLSGGEYALMGCTVAPGFEYADYEHGSRQELIALYPECKAFINELTW